MTSTFPIASPQAPDPTEAKSLPRPVPPPFVPPLASDASRHIVVPDKGSLRGALVTRDAAPRIITYESNLEKRVLLVLLARPDIVEVREQVAPIPYRDEDGRKRKHYFDFWTLREDGRRSLIAVKTSDWARRHGLGARLARIAAHVPRSIADNVVPMTELDAPRNLVHDATLFHCVRDDDRPDDDRRVADIASTLSGVTTIACLVEASGLEGAGFRAVVRLVHAGTLRVVDGGRIDYATRVARASEGAAS